MKKIMIVDDTEAVRETVKMLLEDKYEVMEAENVTTMYEVLKQQKPDLILLDIMMPDGNGVTVKTKLKSMPEYREIPIVFLTAVEDEGTQRIANIQSIEYIKKPFTEEDLLQSIEKAL